MHLLQTRSSRARSDEFVHLTRSRKPTFESLNAIKDLRAKRVFSPSSVVEEDPETDCKTQNLTNVSPILEDVCFGDDELKNMDSGVLVTENMNGSNPSLEDGIEEIGLEADATQGIGSQNGVVSSQSPISGGKLFANLQKPKKLYKAPTSFSYRRLLPYLKAVDNDDSCFPKIEVVDIGLPCKSRNLASKSPNLDLNGHCGFAGKYIHHGAHDDQNSGKNGEITEVDECEVHKFSGGSSNLSQVEGGMELHKGRRGDGLDDLIAECDQVQTTPPDAYVLGKLELDDRVANNVLQNEKPMRKVGGAAESFNDDINYSKSKCELVLKPCSRVKLFKTPSSVSYRRMLPFLIDIAKENSSVSETNQCSKLEKDWEQKPSTVIVSSSPEDNLLDKSETECNSGQHGLGDKEPNLLKPVDPNFGSSAETNPGSPTSMLTSSNGCNSKETVILSFESSIDTPMPFDSKVEVPSQLENVISDRPAELEQESPHSIIGNGHQVNPSSLSLCCAVNHEKFPRNCTELVQVYSTKECSAPQAGFCKDELKPITVTMDQNSFQVEACYSSEVRIGGPRRGILKRNPRGCRGLCNCLNCATFRLHAERAFEFSRNQMQDAEEVALELMKELTDIRNMLKKSTADASYQVVLQGEQVNEACRKALETEELAKMRLSQMNEDLTFHCRTKGLKRPRVAFANNVVKKIIPNGRSQN